MSTVSPEVSLATSPCTPPGATLPTGSGRPALQEAARDAKATKDRISGMFGQSPEVASLLCSKLEDKNQGAQVSAGLGGGVSAAKMNEMLDWLDGLSKKQPPLTPEHVKAIFLAGFVKGGVQGVLNFRDNPENAKYLEAGGFEAMKTLLETDYKRSIRYVVRYANFLENDVPRFLDGLYGKTDVLGDWEKSIIVEDKPVSLDRELTEEEIQRLAQEGFASALDTARVARGRSKSSNPHLEVPAACDDFAFYDAERRGVSRFDFTRLDHSGQSITALEALLKTAKVGTVVHVSYSGHAGENANSAQGSHWAVYLGGGVIQDQWGTYTVSEFNKVYGTRKLEALFINPNM